MTPCSTYPEIFKAIDYLEVTKSKLNAKNQCSIPIILMINSLQMYNQFTLQHAWLLGFSKTYERQIGDAIFVYIVTSRAYITSMIYTLKRN